MLKLKSKSLWLPMFDVNSCQFYILPVRSMGSILLASTGSRTWPCARERGPRHASGPKMGPSGSGSMPENQSCTTKPPGTADHPSGAQGRRGWCSWASWLGGYMSRPPKTSSVNFGASVDSDEPTLKWRGKHKHVIISKSMKLGSI